MWKKRSAKATKRVSKKAAGKPPKAAAGSGGDEREPSNPEHQATPEPEATPEQHQVSPEHEAAEQAGWKALDEYWSTVGELDPARLTYIINPMFSGAPPWPNTRQSYRIVRTP